MARKRGFPVTEAGPGVVPSIKVAAGQLVAVTSEPAIEGGRTVVAIAAVELPADTYIVLPISVWERILSRAVGRTQAGLELEERRN